MSVQDVSDSTYSALSKLISDSWKYYETSTDDDDGIIPPTLTGMAIRKHHQEQVPKPTIIPRRNSFGFTLFNKKSSPKTDVGWLKMFKNNPYNSVRGRQLEPSSMSAVRDLIALVPTHHHRQQEQQHQQLQPPPSSPPLHTSREEENDWRGTWATTTDTTMTTPQVPSNNKNSMTYGATPTSHSRKPTPIARYEEAELLEEDWTERTIDDYNFRNALHRRSASSSSQLGKTSNHNNNQQQQQQQDHPSRSSSSSLYYSPSETASQLAEGTIRALRDLALDEAVELQTALRFWTERWERPVLSWLEAGPVVWCSPQGYNHQEVGRKVSQIQAVLARRCAAIGELQQQLLTAGWAKGVAQWGFLGQGSTQWAAVGGFDNDRNVSQQDEGVERSVSFDNRVRSSSSVVSHPKNDENQTESLKEANVIEIQERNDENVTLANVQQKKEEKSIPGHSSNESSFHPNLLLSWNLDEFESNGLQPKLPEIRKTKSIQTPQARISVRKRHGGGIYIDDPGFLALWSVQAMSLVRRHLYRAGNGMFLIPCQSNWLRTSGEDEGQWLIEAGSDIELPIWASHVDTDAEGPALASLDENESKFDQRRTSRTHVTVTDLPLMVDEVQQLLDIMEDIIIIQKRRRLNKLKQPSWLRCNWYIVATVIPATVMFARSFGENGYVNGKAVFRQLVDAVKSFYREHLRDPLVAIANELVKGREDFSDKNARMEAISSLKKMIYSWLEDTFPEMPEPQRRLMAEAMDVTLLEQRKEESLKAPFYELNNVVRMSFIEMQYMKKEMMNALHAMDAMMSANDINMNIAAITPAVIVAYAVTSIFRVFTYAFLKLGKSREETYASFRHILTDIERLLVMRDNPPQLYPSSLKDQEKSAVVGIAGKQPCLLGPDDLGMLMLLIHECKSIMLKDRRRFSQAIIRSVSEDLAELAGERGAVSVQQQLRIVERMCRSYPFLKVISTGHSVHFNKLRNVAA